MMAGLDDLSAGGMADLVRRVEKLERSPQLGNTSVSRGQTQFIGTLSILVSGSGKVTGTWFIDGALEGEGTLGWSGSAAFDGPVDITDTLDVLAATTLQGDVSLESNLSVKAGGKITVEGSPQIALASAGGTATLQFSDGPRLWSNGAAAILDLGSTSGPRVVVAPGGVSMTSPNGTYVVQANNTNTDLRAPVGGGYITLHSGGASVNMPLLVNNATVTMASLPTKAGAVANLHVDGAGKLWRIP